MTFDLLAQDPATKARAGRIETAHGTIETPIFMPVGTAGTVKAAAQLRNQAHRHNLFIKIPGTREGLIAIEESIFAGVAVNVTLLFSSAQYIAAAEAYLRGIERRIAAGLDPKVRSVASMFISRWDKATMGKVPTELQDRLGIAIAERTYKAYRQLLASERWLKAAGAGAQPQRLLWASTSTKDPAASDILYVKALAAPDTINTIPEKTLLAFADHGAAYFMGMGKDLPRALTLAKQAAKNAPAEESLDMWLTAALALKLPIEACDAVKQAATIDCALGPDVKARFDAAKANCTK